MKALRTSTKVLGTNDVTQRYDVKPNWSGER